MENWWNSIGSYEKIYWFFAVPFTTVFLVQFFLTFSGSGGGEHDGGFEHDGDADGGGHHEGDHAGFNLFTLRNIIIFFTGFGWAGIVGVKSGYGKGLTGIFAFLVGLGLMLAVAGMYYLMSKLTENGNINMQNALDVPGRVYIPIPEGRQGVGQIQLTIQGSIREVEAMTEGDALSTGTPVKVTKVLDERTVIVEKMI